MSTGATTKTLLFTPVQTHQVRYIKLGEGGSWERECLEKGIIRFGFGSANPERFPSCLAGKWADLTKSFLAEGKDKGTATRFTNETRIFFEDKGSILWITFVGEQLCWGFLTNSQPEPHLDGAGVWRSIAGGWRKTDINGEQLTKDRLAGSLNKLAAYRGTSCNVDVGDYVVRRINGQKTPEVERALTALEETKQALLQLIKLLEPKDFEILVDLVFTASGWRRLGIVGSTQKILDLDLWLPSTGELAFVQVKSITNSAEVAAYIERMDECDYVDRMFFVYHSGEAKTDKQDVTVIGPDKLAEMVLDAGLANWLIRKVS